MIIAELVKKSATIYLVRRFIIFFTRKLPRFLFWASWVQYTGSHSISLRYNLILFSCPCLNLPSDLCPPGLLEVCMHFLSSSPYFMCSFSSLAYSIILMFCEDYKLWSFSLFTFHHPSINFSLSPFLSLLFETNFWYGEDWMQCILCSWESGINWTKSHWIKWYSNWLEHLLERKSLAHKLIWWYQNFIFHNRVS